MDGVAFQGMPRIALTPAEEALIPRPHSSASQVATAVPSAYTRTTGSPSSPPRHPHHKNHHSSISYHPYYAHPSAAGSGSLAGLGAHLGSPSSASIPISTTPDPYSRPSSPGPRPVSPSFQNQLAAVTPSASSNNLSTEQEYPQNPQDSYHGYYSQVPARSASPGPSRLAFSLTPRPARSPSPQLYNNLYDHHYQPRTSYFHRMSHDVQPRPGSPLQQEHQESWDSNQRMESLAPESESDEEESQDGNDSDDEREEKQRPTAPRRSTSKSILKRLRETTSRLSFENGRRPSRTSQESEREREREREREQEQQPPRDSQDSTSTTRPGKEVLQDLSDEEKHLEPRKSRSGWRPSLSLIRQESSSSNANQYYLQNDPSRIGEVPSSRNSMDNNNNSLQPSNTKGKRRRRTKGGKDSKKRKRRNKRKRAERLAAQKQLQLQQQLYDQQMAEQARTLPTLTQVLEKKTRYPLSYEDFEAFLRTQRAVEYLNFWADVTAHEQLCRTFDVSERRHKREQQLEERALARDKRRMALFAAMEADRMTPDPDLLVPGHAGIGAGVGMGAISQEIHNSNLYVASRSSLQLPLNDHLSFPQESPRRYGLQDSSAPFPPLPPSLSSNNVAGTASAGAYNRLLAGPGEAVGTGGRISGEMSRPSLEEAAHISEQDAAVAAVAMRAQNSGLYTNNQSREDVRRGSFDIYRPLPGSVSVSNIARYQNTHGNHGGTAGNLPTSYSTPAAFNLLMRGRGSMDVGVARSSSRNSRRAPASEDYFGNGIRRTSSQQFVHQSPQSLHPHGGQDDNHATAQGHGRSSQDDHPTGEDPDHVIRRQTSQYSIGFMEPDVARRPSVRYGGFGPLQAPVSIRRSGESAYTPSIFSSGQEGKALLALSFRTISLEDLQESALRIYRKYLIQLRTTSMAAEEEAAAQRSAAAKDSNGNYAGFPRGSLDKAIAPGWDGYAEEVIAQWNENWKGRSHEARRSRRLSRNRSVTARNAQGDGDGSAFPSVAGEDSSSQADRQSSDIGGGGLTVDTGKANAHDAEDDDGSSQEDERITPGGTRKKVSSAKSPTSPTSPRMRKRTGTGLSAMLNPFLTRLMRTETTVVELPTLTINTTTIEEATAGDESDDDEEDDDEEEDYDSDEEDDDDDDDDDQSDEGEDSPPVSTKIIIDSGSTGLSENQDEGLQSLSARSQEEQVVVVERSMPTITATPPPMTDSNGPTEKAALQDAEPEKKSTGREGTHVRNTSSSPKVSSSSSLSSSWDRITKRDLEKQVTILPPPNTTSARTLPYRRHGSILGVRSTTGKATKAASSTALRVGTQLSALLSKSMRGVGGSSSSSLDTIQVTPITPRTNIGFRFHIPSIVMENQNEGEDDQEKAMEEGRSRTPPVPKNNQALSFPIPVANNCSVNGATSGGPMNEKMSLGDPQQPSVPPGSKPFLTPQTSAVTRPSSAASSPEQSTTAAADTPQFSVSSPAAVAASAAAAAFYLPLECRQRIHTQVQEEGRTEAPYLFGPAKGFVMDVVLEDHYYPLFLKYVEQQNLGLLNKTHANNVVKQRGMLWIGIVIWLIVLAIQLTLVLLGMGGWESPWVWVVGTAGGWTGSICLATGIKGFSPILGILGKMCEDRRLFRFRHIMEPSIRVRHRRRAFWMLSYCIFWSTVVMVIFAALPQARVE
ncbi:hypothetical protein KVV02_000908 [Mortierella alpina]|uniref:RGS domain-containing protein n=1 Tax=Mortierella alpina TaxID=64518 RepID=A0A9P8D2B3_MORAP|nr:hypothetical protein KVV02_000908 [Mortierella alpina]